MLAKPWFTLAISACFFDFAQSSADRLSESVRQSLAFRRARVIVLNELAATCLWRIACRRVGAALAHTVRCEEAAWCWACPCLCVAVPCSPHQRRHPSSAQRCRNMNMKRGHHSQSGCHRTCLVSNFSRREIGSTQELRGDRSSQRE
jgi:hypothetical protein